MEKKKSAPSIHSGHRLRLKNNFLKNGIDTFEEHQILEMLLFYSIPQIDTNPIAHRLLNKFGSLDKVFDAPISELISVEGVGESTATLLKFIPQLSRKYNEAKVIKKTRIYSYEQIVDIFKAKFIGIENEQIVLLLLSSDGTLLYCDTVNEGSINSVPVYVRKILNLALTYNADTAIIAHNHPSGNAMPSSQDIASTRELFNALDGANIHFEDHIIIAGDEYSSMKQSGWLSKIKTKETTEKDAVLSEIQLILDEQRKLKKQNEKGMYNSKKKSK